MRYPEALAFLDSHLDRERALHPPVAGETAGLDLSAMEALVEVLGEPQHAYPVLHVTGTNGKGSVGHLLGRLLTAAGLSTGVYSSPHLERVNERVVWSGQPIPDDELARVLSELAAVEPLVGRANTWFELMTAAAFQWFADVAVDAAVIEVGLLGRHDATNVVDGQVAVVTNVGRDHTDFRPGWELAIAAEKAGIVRPGSHLVAGRLSDDLLALFRAEQPSHEARLGHEFEVTGRRLALGGQLLTIQGLSGTYEDAFLRLHGEHQADNAAIALAAAEAFFDARLDDDVVAEAFGGANLAGRFEVIGRRPLIVVDVAHNPDGAERVRRTLEEELTFSGSRVLLTGLLEGRDPEVMLEAFGARSNDLVIAVDPHSPRAMPASRLLEAASSLGISAEFGGGPEEGVERALSIIAEEDLLLVSGSFSVVGPARSHLLRIMGGAAQVEG